MAEWGMRRCMDHLMRRIFKCGHYQRHYFDIAGRKRMTMPPLHGPS